MSGTAPGTTGVTPYEWSADLSRRDRVFTPVQPYLDPEATGRGFARKEAYRGLRETGRR